MSPSTGTITFGPRTPVEDALKAMINTCTAPVAEASAMVKELGARLFDRGRSRALEGGGGSIRALTRSEKLHSDFNNNAGDFALYILPRASTWVI